MSSLISAIDHHQTTMQLGENGHVEHAWVTAGEAAETTAGTTTEETTEENNKDLQEQLTQLFFQLVRTEETEKLDQLMIRLESILKTLSKTPLHPNTTHYLDILYRMMLQTRDTVSGKGEYALAYRMVLSWYKYFPALAVRALESFVLPPPETPSKQPFGSWKDMKCMAELCKKTTGNEQHELIQTCIRLINVQLKEDTVNNLVSEPNTTTNSTTNISLCAKWVPREGSRYAWLFKALSVDFYSSYIFDNSLAKKKAYMNYRKMLANLNRQLDTVQIKQCGNVWADIDHHKTTSITLSRNKKAFLNLTKKGDEVRSDRPDRIECAKNFTEYINERVKTGKTIKGRHVGMNDFTKLAIELIDKTEYDSDNVVEQIQQHGTEIELLNAQWRSNSAAINPLKLGNMVAMVDTSTSMTSDKSGPLHAAIALGIRVAEKSVLGKRVLTFDTTPTWHNLEGKEDFVSMVESLKYAKWGGSTNFYAALKLILDALIAQQVPPKEVEGLVLAVFSDMQIDVADRTYQQQSMQATIHHMYQEAGYTCPHILFWNLTSTSGFPCLSSTPNTSMMSGFSPALLNIFCEKGVEALQTATPWSMMLDVLNHERFST
jgi:hypothetical protein